jgi:hypothetical protein
LPSGDSSLKRFGILSIMITSDISGVQASTAAE